jgi:hypothetical protein
MSGRSVRARRSGPGGASNWQVRSEPAFIGGRRRVPAPPERSTAPRRARAQPPTRAQPRRPRRGRVALALPHGRFGTRWPRAWNAKPLQVAPQQRARPRGFEPPTFGSVDRASGRVVEMRAVRHQFRRSSARHRARGQRARIPLGARQAARTAVVPAAAYLPVTLEDRTDGWAKAAASTPSIAWIEARYGGPAGAPDATVARRRRSLLSAARSRDRTAPRRAATLRHSLRPPGEPDRLRRPHAGPTRGRRRCLGDTSAARAAVARPRPRSFTRSASSARAAAAASAHAP